MSRRVLRQRLLTPALLALMATTMQAAGLPALAADDEATELAKKTQNPVADLISVPFQNNFNFNTGPKDATVWVLNVQPVIPIKLTEDWNLITRTIMPIINQPSLRPAVDSAFGLGDINPSLFLSPAKPGAVIWGVGPTFTFPTATDSQLGSGKWSLGPTAVALTMQGPWVVGALANNQWSLAGWGDEDVNPMLLQPFVNYNFGRGLVPDERRPSSRRTGRPEAATSGRCPWAPGVGKLFKLGKLPINTSLQAYYNAVKPDFGSDWQLRFQVQFLLPNFQHKPAF